MRSIPFGILLPILSRPGGRSYTAFSDLSGAAISTVHQHHSDKIRKRCRADARDPRVNRNGAEDAGINEESEVNSLGYRKPSSRVK
jgi:hypothetical protein